MNTTTKRKQSPELLLLKNSDFPSLRSTYEDCGWVTNGKVMFLPSESFAKKIKALACYKKMDAEAKSASKGINQIIKSSNLEITDKVSRLEFVDFSKLEDEVMLADHAYRIYGCNRKDKLQWNGGYVDLVTSQYENASDATMHLSGERLVFKIGRTVVAIIQGVIFK